MSPVERESTSPARSAAHAVHVLHHDARGDARVLHPALDRVDASRDAVQALILVPDPETAVALAGAARADAEPEVRLVPLTSASRGARLLRAGGVRAVAATPRLAAALRHAAALKLEEVSTIVFAWADEMLAAGEGEALDALMADVPAGARILVTSELTDEVRSLEERFMRRPRHEDARGEAAEPVTLRYVETATAQRAVALRRLLDELDPPSCAVVAWSDEAAADAERALSTLGYGAADDAVRLTRGDVEENTTLVVCYELPPDADALAKVSAAKPSAVAVLVAPRQVPALRHLSGGAAVPWLPAQAIAKARSRADKIRDALRAELADEWPAKEIMLLEPLLAEHDGVELAAAAVRLVERERERARAATPRPSAVASAPATAVTAPAAPEGFTRVFLSIGEEDGVRKGDLVGAIAGESGITSNEIGRIEIRDRHTLVEIATAVHERVIEKMTGVSIRGRRVTARVDKGREGAPPRAGGARGPARGGPRGDRPPGRSFDRGDRGDRGAPRGGPRSFDRGDREDRGPRGGGARSFDRGERGERGERSGPPRGGPRAGGGARGGPPRAGGFGRGPGGGPGRGPGRDRDDRGPGGPRGPRAREEHREWADRGERVRNARRPRRDDS